MKIHLLFSCSRVKNLELVSILTATEFSKCFTKSNLRRGKPNMIYSDKQKTLRQEQNGWTEGKKSMIFWVRKGLSGNSSFQGYYCVEGSKSV